MCKHIANAQVSIRAPCCHKWFDCPLCHAERSDHELEKAADIVLGCKKCRKVFRVSTDNKEFEEADEYCPHCDNHYVLDAEGDADAGQAGIAVEFDSGEQIDSRVKSRGEVRWLADAWRLAVAHPVWQKFEGF